MATVEEIVEFIKQTNNELTNKQIIEELDLDCSSENITNIRRRHGLPKSPRNKHSNKQTNTQTNKQTSEEAIDARVWIEPSDALSIRSLWKDIKKYLEKYYVSKEMKLKINLFDKKIEVIRNDRNQRKEVQRKFS